MAAKVEVIFAGDTKNLDSAFRRTRGEADRMGNAVDGNSRKAGGALGKLGGLAKGLGGAVVASIGVGAVGAMFDFGVSTLKAYETIETGQKRAETVFGDSIGMVREFASNIDQFMGLSTNQVVALTASIGDILVPMGFARDRAAELSTQMVDLATKLSIAAGVPIEQAINATTAAMVGEYDSLKSLGIQLSAAEVQSLLAASGQDKLTGVALKQAEAEIVLKEMLRQTTDAQGQANQKMAEGGLESSRLESTIANLKDRLTLALGPALSDAAEFLGQLATALFDADADSAQFRSGVNETADTIRGLVADVKELWGQLDRLYQKGKAVGDFLNNVDNTLDKAAGWVNRTLGNLNGFDNRANGGQVTGPTVVGERGPELLFPGPGGGGTVIPHGKAGYGGGTTVIVNVAGSVVAERDLARTLEGIMSSRSSRRGF